MASISMLLQEIGGRWTVLSIIIQLVVAYVVALFVYNIAFAIEIFGPVKPIIMLLTLLIFVFAVCFIVKKIKRGQTCAHCENCDKSCKDRK